MLWASSLANYNSVSISWIIGLFLDHIEEAEKSFVAKLRYASVQ
ncbi:hypothetical protein RchiOBHm_Chr1g0318391 [Rosa chinensis]|uniref:Uncharacterized protein n=1 Tax=Rosa chinensis TaxID=74649 RepID=A0A2P6S852_ROSCH|nr:hypothetical protein RchiOBHm_Chr1g0318391 [Rosa chinensis]